LYVFCARILAKIAPTPRRTDRNYSARWGVFLVDELECSFNLPLIREIVLLFKKRRHSPQSVELIFTTDTDSEIALVRKKISDGTLVRRLGDAKNDREVRHRAMFGPLIRCEHCAI
jgi:hypothetical protein